LFSSGQETSVKEKEKKQYLEEVEEFFEPIIGCKQPIIVLEATSIGSTEHAPDGKDAL
jgi:hypothetical protein